MARRKRAGYRQPRINPVIIISVVLVVAVAAGIFLWINYNRQLRINMEKYLESAAEQTELGEYETALEDAENALFAAYRLREYELADLADTYIRLINVMFRADNFYVAGNYKEAIDSYLHAIELASDINGLGTELIEKKIQSAQRYIAFYTLIEHAERIIEISGYDSTELLYEEKLLLYKTVISMYEDAKRVASSLSFSEGIAITETGIEEAYTLIAKAKHTEAMSLFFRGNQLYNIGEYKQALDIYNDSLELFIELDDTQNIGAIREKIDFIELWLLGTDEDKPPPDDNPQDSTGEINSNYEFNMSIDFDLTTLIDNQNRSPANQIRMGSRDGRNEGWYNGCGWVATYNALLLLDIQKHPAEIVRYFEESGGTVLDGVYGTYPNAIEEYIRSFDFNVNRTTFPQLTLNIDDVIKASKVSILTYVHTSAAHYITIEYRAEIDKFIIYNDSLARTRSSSLGFSGLTETGAAVDSVAAFINNTREILFSFSLITIK